MKWAGHPSLQKRKEGNQGGCADAPGGTAEGQSTCQLHKPKSREGGTPDSPLLSPALISDNYYSKHMHDGLIVRAADGP